MYENLDPLGDQRTPASRRSARALLNDQSIRRATVNSILRQGVDAISFRDIGRDAGLTHGALYARCEDVEELLVDVWANELCARAISMMALASKAAARPSDAAIHDVITYVREASATDQATIHVLLASRRFPVLREEIESFVRDYLETGADLSIALHSRALVVFSLMITATFLNAQYESDEEYLDFLEEMLCATLKVDPQDIVPVNFPEAFDNALPTPRADIRSQLAFETFNAIAKSGYTRATISRISRRANCSPGSIYKIYPSKDALVVATIRMVMKAPWLTTTNLCAILDEGVLAQLLSESASGHNDIPSHFTLEVSLASIQNANLREALQSKLQDLELLVPFVSGFNDDERTQMGCMIRLLVLLSLGASFLSTVTSATDHVDFNQFAEPLRRALVRSVTSWSAIQSHLMVRATPQQPEQEEAARLIVNASVL